ncbi:MAG: succinylglutamate desuccinylase/aspartoacylase family protein [Candidatus Ratteibacteria bacterium]
MKEIESIIVTDAKKRYRIPFYSIQGKASGKTLLLIAGQHGGEWNGIEVIRRVFQEINPSLLTGRVLAVPVANPMAVTLGEQMFLFDKKEKRVEKYPPRFAVKNKRYNMNLMWPGKKDGSVLEKIVAAIWEKGVLPCDILLDFHSYSRNQPHSAYVTPETLPFGRALNLGFLADVSQNKALSKETLSATARRNGKIALTVEFVGEQEVIEEEVCDGVAGVFNLMRFLKMIPGKVKRGKKQYLLNTAKRENMLLYSPCQGFVLGRKKPLERVKKGEIICEIFDLYKGKVVASVESPINGRITHRRYVSVVKKGDIVTAVSDLFEV